MSYVQVGACPQCGSPIYTESPWMSTLPPPSRRTCGCGSQWQTQLVTTTSTGTALSLPQPKKKGSKGRKVAKA